MDEEFADRVLDLVEEIPVGRVLTYGGVAERIAAGYGPRYVGRVMATHGAAVPWWRVVRADGTLPPVLMLEAQRHWHAEGTLVRRGRVHLAEALWPGVDRT